MVAVGHNDLGGRGYNADVWVHEQHAYVGSWGFTDYASGSKQSLLPQRRRSPSSTPPIRAPPSCRHTGQPGRPPRPRTWWSSRRVTGCSPAATSRSSGSRSAAATGPTRHPPRPPGLRRDRSCAARGDRLPWHGLLRARPARAGGPGSRRPEPHLRLRERANQRVQRAGFAERAARPDGTRRLPPDRHHQPQAAGRGLQLGRAPEPRRAARARTRAATPIRSTATASSRRRTGSWPSRRGGTRASSRST